MEMEKKKINSSKIWTGSIIAALIAAVSVFTVMLQMEKKVLTNYEKGQIFVAAKEIPKGQVITKENYQIYFEQKELDKSVIPETALQSAEQVEGLISAFKIEQGVLLTSGMFEEVNEVTINMKNPVIAGCKADDLYQVVGGVLRTGDRVHIYVVNENAEAKLVWDNVFVQEVFDQSGTTISNEDNSTAAQRMNLYMDKQDIETFYRELALGSLRVVKVCQ